MADRNKAFRFFINVGQCLNMSNFDIFFYQKRSRHELHLTPDVFITEGTGMSFRKAAADIRMYLDRHSATVSDYQIIIAMRGDYKSDVNVWKDTFLSRLLDIDFDLRLSNIFARAGIAVNMIMLYETNLVRTLNVFDVSYMNSPRLVNDCKLLLREIGVPQGKENDLDALRAAWSSYSAANKEYFDSFPRMNGGVMPANSMYVFFTDLLNQYESDRKTALGSELDNQVSIYDALKEVLKGYQTFEIITDRQNRSKDIASLLRIVEFSTTDFVMAEGTENTISLPELCSAHWNRITQMDDADILRKYTEMLCNYRDRLQRYANSQGYYSADAKAERLLPECNVPDMDDIRLDKSVFDTKARYDSGAGNPSKLVEEFKKKLSPRRTLLSRWNTCYSRLRNAFRELHKSLDSESEMLSNCYIHELEKRKEIEREWQKKSYVENDSTQQEINDLEKKRAELLNSLNQPHMTPSLRLQDQLNIESALEQENLNIIHYIKCIQSVSAKSFLLLILLLTGMVALMYGLLQTYNFNAIVTIIYYLAYLGASALIMFFAWGVPTRHYQKKLNSSLASLEDDLSRYISGYFDRAKQFREYINIVNMLDYVERHLSLRRRAVSTSEWMIKAHNWHVNQSEQHLKKLSFFSLPITNTFDTGTGFNDGNVSFPEISKDHVDDVVDCELYWPQS